MYYRPLHRCLRPLLLGGLLCLFSCHAADQQETQNPLLDLTTANEEEEDAITIEELKGYFKQAGKIVTTHAILHLATFSLLHAAAYAYKNGGHSEFKTGLWILETIESPFKWLAELVNVTLPAFFTHPIACMLVEELLRGASVGVFLALVNMARGREQLSWKHPRIKAATILVFSSLLCKRAISIHASINGWNLNEPLVNLSSSGAWYQRVTYPLLNLFLGRSQESILFFLSMAVITYAALLLYRFESTSLPQDEDYTPTKKRKKKSKKTPLPKATAPQTSSP